MNAGRTTYKIEKYAPIAQLTLNPMIDAKWEAVDGLSTTGRGEGGFGSTGKTHPSDYEKADCENGPPSELEGLDSETQLTVSI